MTITEPEATESVIEHEMASDPIIDELTIDLTDPTGSVLQIDDEEETSLLRDPLLPFLVVGTVSLIALVVVSYLLTSGNFTF